MTNDPENRQWPEPDFEDLSDLDWEAEPDLPEYDFDGRAYHKDGTRWPEYDATIYSGVNL